MPILPRQSATRRRLTAPTRRIRAVRCLVAAMVAASVIAAAPASAGAQQEGFSDVEPGVHTPAIDALAELGLFEGTLCGEAMFCPADPVERTTMAVWLTRALEDEDPTAIDASRFADVDAAQWWAPFVERIAELEITVGCKQEPLLYCPDELVTRARMASFLVRAFDLEPAEPAGFADVDGGSHEPNINALAAANITVGCKKDPLRYCPDNPVSRAQMATFLARALGLVEIPGTTTQTPITSGFKAVDAGQSHSCVIRADDTITCWGSNAYGLDDAPAGTYKAVTAGGLHSCAIRTDDTIACWGDDEFGQADAPAGTYKAITGGYQHSCAMRTDDTIACWGLNDNGQTDAPAGTHKAVTGGGNHTCAIRTDDTIACWGLNESRQTDAPAGTHKAVTGGWKHTCAIRTDDTIACWGLNESRQTDAPAGTHKRHRERRHRERTPHLCDTNQRHHHLLGKQQLRTGQRASGSPQSRHRRRAPLMCHRNGRHHHLLGKQRSRADRRPSGHARGHPNADPQGHRYRRTSHLCDTSRRHHHLLGTQRSRASRRASRHVQGRRRRQHPRLRDTNRRHHRMLGKQRSRASRRASRHLQSHRRRRKPHLRVRTDDTIACWGRNDDGQTDAPKGAYKAVAAGGLHTCAYTTDYVNCDTHRRHHRMLGTQRRRADRRTQGRLQGRRGRRSPHVRLHHRLRQLLGMERIQAGRLRAGHRQSHRRRAGPLLRHRYRRHHNLLGVKCRRGHRSPRRHLQGRRHRPRRILQSQHQQFSVAVTHVRHTHRRHHRMLGIGLLRSDQRPGGHLQGRHRRRVPHVRHTHRRHHYLLGRQRIRANRRAIERHNTTGYAGTGQAASV